ncbi:hypothetical protein ACKWTF_003768 [Chironomus riparius]
MWKNLLFYLSMILLASLADSAEIGCEWFGESCSPTSISPITQPNEAITVIGKPSNYVNTATRYLHLDHLNPSLSYIPTRLFTIFQGVTTFTTKSSSSKLTLVTNAFANCNSLNKLSIYGAKISNVPEGFAQTCSNIITLLITNSGIETVDKNAFKGLTNLVELNMSYNQISCLPPELFMTVPNIKLIYFYGNRISALDSSLFRNLPKLIAINFMENSLTFLPSLDLTGTAQYERLIISVSDNPIRAFKPDVCNFFDSRPANFDDILVVININCFKYNTAKEPVIQRSNCRTALITKDLKNCYANWTSTMDAPVKCGTSCPWSSIWQQILDYLKTQV